MPREKWPVSWYWHCLGCNHHFKIPTATYKSLVKVKTPIYCPRCGLANAEKSFKHFCVISGPVIIC